WRADERVWSRTVTGALPLMRLLQSRADALPPRQRVLARYVQANYQSVAFSTIADLARAACVSEATVVRFANLLGFDGYPALQKEVRRIVRADLKGTERFHLLERQRPRNSGTLERVLAAELDNLRHLQAAGDSARVRDAAAALRRARRILVVGARSA